MRKGWLTLVSFFVLVGCNQQLEKTSLTSPNIDLPKGVTFVEQLVEQPDQISIPYSKYKLDNGLTVVLSPDHSDPLVHVDLTYHVGSAREEVGKSGFAHFFEHMMFQGSENVADQQHFKLVTEAGGSLNGTTNQDRTNYFQTVPANQLEKVLWLEADRMGFLLGAVSQKKFEIQRDTVKNERAQNFDNKPYGLIWERMAEAMYPEGHPYSWPTIGYVEDLDRVDVNDLKAFFLRWYGPNNATLTIGGDIDIKQTLSWISKYFSTIPRGPEVKQAPKQPAVLSEDRFITLQDRIRQPMVVIGWPTTYAGSEEQIPLDMLASSLGSGINSPLYQKLVKTEKALDAGAFHRCSELACNFYVYAMLAAESDASGGEDEANGKLASIHRDLIQVLDEFKRQGVSQAELKGITAGAEASAIFALQSVRGKVAQLASNQTFYGTPNRINSVLEKIDGVTPDMVSAVFNQYISEQHSVTLSVVPKGKIDLAVKAATFTSPKRALPEYLKIDDEQLIYRTPVDHFDRSIMPEVASAVYGKTPQSYQFLLDNGIQVTGSKTSETPTVQILIQFPSGHRYVEPGKEGLASLTAALLQEGTQLSTPEQLETRLDKLGSSYGYSVGNYRTTISIASLTKNLAATLEIVEEELLKPAFNAKDFERVKNQALQGLIYQQQRPAWLATQATKQILFSNTLFERSNSGTLASLENISLDDIQTFYQTHYTSSGAQVIAVGDISANELEEQLQFLARWQSGEVPKLQPQKIASPIEQKIYLVDKPNSPQSTVRLVSQGLPFDADGDFYLTQLANFNLAGNFNSRINQNLREDKGFSYGAKGYIAGNREMGMMVFEAQVRSEATLASIKELIKELKFYSEKGITEDELQFMQLAVGQQDALSYETPGQKVMLLASMVNYSLDSNYIEKQNSVLQQLSKSEIDKVAALWFNPDRYQIIVVGDSKSLKPQLESMNIPVVELEIKK